MLHKQKKMLKPIGNDIKKVPSTFPLAKANIPPAIPEEELAQEIRVSIRKNFDLEKLVPPEEREVAPKDMTAKVENIRTRGFFSPVKNMSRITGALHDKISARIFEDANGQRFVEYIQQYSDGSFSPVMRLSQAGIKIALHFHFETDEIHEKKLRNTLEAFLADAFADYYGKFKGPSADEMDIKDILNTLSGVINLLPVTTEQKAELTGESFYYSVVNCIYDIPSACMDVDNYKSYYALDDETMCEVAKKMGMTKLDLVKKLNFEGFLYIPSSSRGYQANVRIKSCFGGSYTEWRYCIYKVSAFAGVEEDFRNFISADDINF